MLILVPRHPERFESVFELTKNTKFKSVKRTSDEPVTTDTQVYLGDTMGEMLVLIGAADICFMGGSLLGDKIGGHNVLEPAALGVPVIIGPSYFNFKEITENLRNQQGIIICELMEVSEPIIQLIDNKIARESLKVSALDVVLRNQGALARTVLASQR